MTNVNPAVSNRLQAINARLPHSRSWCSGVPRPERHSKPNATPNKVPVTIAENVKIVLISNRPITFDSQTTMPPQASVMGIEVQLAGEDTASAFNASDALLIEERLSVRSAADNT